METSSSGPASTFVPILPGDGDERVLHILECITDGLYCFDADWRFTFINETGKRILSMNGVNADGLIGQSYWDEFPETRQTLIGQEFQRAVAEQISVEFETFYPPWNRWFSIRAYPIRSGGLAVYFQEITQAKEAERALRESEERYRTLFNSIDDGFCVIEMVWDKHGQPQDYLFQEINPAFETHTGLKDAVGKTMKELNPVHEAHWFEIYGKVAREQKPLRFSQSSESLKRQFDLYAFPIGLPQKSQVAVIFKDVTNRHQAEFEVNRLDQEKRARVAELETLLDVLPIGIAIANDPECRNIRINKVFSSILEVPQGANASKTAPEGEAPTNFRVTDDWGNEIPNEKLPMQVAAREGIAVRDCEINVVHADGREVRLLESIAPLFDEDGKPRGSIGAFVDITERRKQEKRQSFLVELDDAVRPLGDAEEIVAISARLLGEYLQVNRCAYADIGEDQDTMSITGDYTRGVPSIVGRFTFTQFGEEVLRLMRADQPYVVEDVEVLPLSEAELAVYHETQIRAVICVPLHKEGRFVGAMAVHMTTARQWTEDEVSLVQLVANRCWEALQRAQITRVLQESEERFRQIADIMPQVVWLANPDGYVSYYNRRWYELSGRPDGEVGSISWLAVMHPEDIEHSIDRWAHSVRTGEDYQTRYRWRDQATGAYRWYLGRGVPLRDERGEVIRWYGTSTDIDDVVRAEELAREAKAEAERANRAKDEFLAVLSHELRTPLTPVLMAAEDLCEDPALPSHVHDTLYMMRRNIMMEARLIDDLLDLTRIIHGKLALRLQKTDAHSLIALALEIVRDEAQAKGLVIEVKLLAQHAWLECDPSRLQQVFWNLLKNAVKFTPARGRISIVSRNEGERLLVEVTDDGIGIAPETLQKIFLPFEQAGLANDHRFGGLGLGLAISKAIVDMHGGGIFAESAGQDCGATFRVELPVVSFDGDFSRDSDPSQDTSKDNRSSDSLPLRLLLVEDHEPTLTVLARLLRRAGHHVDTASLVADAERLAKGSVYDLVVSDIGLPDGTGIDLMRRLRDRHGLRGIALTGYGMEEDQRLAYEAGFVNHLTKPVDFAQLRRVLAEAVR
ncbi:PAS domain S-box-containing protein [Prosthecobacter debontii]|uniref:histidine kinase n=1 Tax=Prosthecobacter debontii TaxID=48467 RepID=A0A1T4WWM0_9BACT|nr:PAS domain-containing protein [Prosthecobacter debontii]SKA81694.1 PAS domain S-box-containing protein [Prosthecobacter debontii]